MFDLFKDIDRYRGIPPYASEHYGVYQPLLGWESNLTKKWIQRGGILIDPRVKRILDGRILPGPETVLNPLLGRFIDRRGNRLPIRIALLASIVVSLVLAWATSTPAVAVLVVVAAIAYGSLYTPGMTLLSDAADRRGIAAALAFGAMNGAWAAGNVVGPALGGWLADVAGNSLPYLLLAAVCLATLAATTPLVRSASRPAGVRWRGTTHDGRGAW